MGATDRSDDRVDRDVSIDDRRVAEIFDTRRLAHEALKRAEMVSQDGSFEDKVITSNVAHARLKAYIIACEDIIRDDTEEAWHYWANHRFGQVRFEQGDDPPTYTIRGLDGIMRMDPLFERTYEIEHSAGSFMRGRSHTETETKLIDVDTLWSACRITTHLLSQRGFEISEIESNSWEI